MTQFPAPARTGTPGRALIISGGWPGHQPQVFARLIQAMLESGGLQVTHADTLDVLSDPGALGDLALIVPNWTMGRLSGEQSRHLRAAVQAGTGLGGFHGGMGDAFREDTDYQFMVGGQFVAHPGNVRRYRVDLTPVAHPVTAGLDPSFEVDSEQYYMHTDPTNTVLATTTFDGRDAPWTQGAVIPAAWVRRYGQGRVFYSSVGHHPPDFGHPTVAQLHRRGLLWAAGRPA
ncbi:ThuA domain-containing protein (plasmid) [Deinococcus taeanensis]|uniref:ThuA domain-containing protein n=1 Tax=Deinococcus taeanensis TaxID=2737050 RepID=UPI001CDD058F|nr:ThuA domain-containing protein [Deinococcus taeanensis]UBV44268.1 ThuA domain-containing protein [Deinococcus taeanensis]